MQSELDLVWSVVETSPAGDTVVGIYTTLSRARDVVTQLANGRFEDYRIEGHTLDHGKDEDVPWQVYLGRVGEHLGTTPFAGCNCSDDEIEFQRRSFIERDGESMSVIVFAPTPGHAIATADHYREWLQEQGLWAPLQRLHPLQAAPSGVPATV